MKGFSRGFGGCGGKFERFCGLSRRIYTLELFKLVLLVLFDAGFDVF